MEDTKTTTPHDSSEKVCSKGDRVLLLPPSLGIPLRKAKDMSNSILGVVYLLLPGKC